MSTIMSAELVAALNASFTAGGWRLVGVFVDRHVESDGVTTWTRLHATLQTEHEARGLLHVWTLEGIEGTGYASARLTAGGCALETDDAALIEKVAALRAAGEIVIQVLPGHEQEQQEFACDRELVMQAGRWSVRRLDQA